jgi:hypothetical protein
MALHSKKALNRIRPVRRSQFSIQTYGDWFLWESFVTV